MPLRSLSRVAFTFGLLAIASSGGCANQWGGPGPSCPPQSEEPLFSAWCDAYPESRIPPNPPLWAVNAGIEGHVEMELEIDRAGTVTRVRVVESVPLGVFDFAARESARQLRFEPLAAGEPDYPSNVPYRLIFSVRRARRR